MHFSLALVALFLVTLSSQAQNRQEPGAVIGRVLDAETGEPVNWVRLMLEEAGRWTFSHEDGDFRIINIAPGTYTLRVFRLGYESLQRSVTVESNKSTRVTLRMASSVLMVDGVTIEGTAAAIRADDLGTPVVSLSDRSLRQNLSTTIAETLEGQTGVRMRSMGPAPARPVLRGLGGERLLVLEDGERTGDLSATSSDHAVVIEPLTASRIEVVRGPAALMYGSNTQGGVINVGRDYIPTNTPERLHIEASTQAESVNRGLATGLSAQIPLRKFTFSADGSYRDAQNVQTPVGELANTQISTLNGSLGTTYRYRKGYVGVAGSFYDTAYGIPGGFVGAHPNGVTVEIQRRHLEARTEFLPSLKRIPRIEANYTYSWYAHQEFEASDILGVEFGVIAYHGKIVARTQNLGPFQRGAFGIWGQYRDYHSGGISFTPNATQQTAAIFGFQSWQRNRITVDIGLRADFRRLAPDEESESRIIGLIRERSFSGWSGAATLTWQLGRWQVGTSLTRSLRMPALEELYSEGPHLAAYSFEIGDPTLGAETGVGVELFGGYRSTRFESQLTLFNNTFDSYLFPRNTGETNVRLLLPLYRISNENARMYGFEASATYRLTSRWDLSAQASSVHGTFTSTNEPMPWIPPLSGNLSMRYRLGRFTLNAIVRAATAQDRLGPFEEKTSSYAVGDVFAQVYFSKGTLLHTFDIGVKNVTDTEYRDHLSRVKSIMPEPGLNLKVLYKVYF